MVRFEHSPGIHQKQTLIHADLQNVYGMMLRICYSLQLCRFSDGRQTIENEPRGSRPVSVLTKKNVATVKTLIEKYTQEIADRRINLHSFAMSFKDFR